MATTYYAKEVPWELWEKLLLFDGTGTRHIMTQSREASGATKTWRADLPSVREARRQVLTFCRSVGNSRPVSVHGTPNRSRLFVLDFDIRGQAPFVQMRCRHGRSSVCAFCWEHLKIVVQLVRYQVEQVFQLPGPPLVVFSGGNGIHIWYAIQAFSQQSVLFNSTVGRDRVLASLAVLLKSRGYKLDEDVSRVKALSAITNEPVAMEHTIKLPFSMHSAVPRIAVPIDPDRVPLPVVARTDLAEGQRELEAKFEWNKGLALFKKFCNKL